MRNNSLVGVVSWKRNTFNDYPGKIAAILFFGGCNLRCPFCHNPHIVFSDFSKIEPFNSNEFFDFLQKRRGILKGVVLSGGEPTLYPNIKTDISAIRSLGYEIKLDTNGMLPDIIELFAPDYLALDVKTIPSLYKNILKAGYDDVEQRLCRSIEIVRAMEERAEIRITVAAEIIDDEKIRQIAELIHGVKRVFLQPMQQNTPLLDPAYERKKAPSVEEIRKYREMLSAHVERCDIRGS